MQHGQGFDIDRTQRRLGPLWLAPGITPQNVLALYFVGMMSIVFITGIGLLQPYLLTEHLRLPSGEQGNFTANLIVMVEIVAILIVAPAGILSDRIGRRVIYTGAFLTVAVGAMLLPLASSEIAFVIFRLILGIGTVTCTVMLASIIADYPQNPCRGTLISSNGVITGIGVALLSALVLAQLPGFYVGLGAGPTAAGTFTFWTLAAAAVVAAGFAFFGLSRKAPHTERHRPSFAELMQTGLAEVRNSPRLSLACLAYFVSRGDLQVFVYFFSLWLYAVAETQGMPSDVTSGAVGRWFGLSQLSMVVFTPVMGILCDRIDRVTALAVGMAVGALGFLALGTIEDPLNSPWMYLVAILGGAGEACVIVSGPALVGQEAPARLRGSVIGVVSLCGAVGVLIHSKVSGVLFDGWDIQAPFLYMAILNALVAAVAVAVRMRVGARAKPPTPAAAE